jgi:hypothetical protein
MAAAVGLESAAPAPPKPELSAAASAKPALLAAGGIVAVGGALLAVWALQTPDASRHERSEADLARAARSAAVAASASADVQKGTRPGRVAAEVPPNERAVSAVPGVAPGVSADLTPTQPLPSAAPIPGAVTTPETQVETPTRGPALPRPAAKPSVGSTAAAASKPPPALAITETQILRDARLVLDRDPRSALALSEQHRRDYPSGSFTQERELIAITALVKLGRHSEASERATRFRSAYPSSPYRARLDRILP